MVMCVCVDAVNNREESCRDINWTHLYLDFGWSLVLPVHTASLMDDARVASQPPGIP
jgi:hypothetical protein